MDTFTQLEETVLASIFSETPNLASALKRQMAAATVTKRENSGAGFFTTIAVPITVVKVSSSVLGRETNARVQGLEHGMGFVLFLRDGRLATLEGYTHESTDTRLLDLEKLDFEVFREPINRIG